MSFFFFKQKTAYEMRISDWSSDVCSSDLPGRGHDRRHGTMLVRDRIRGGNRRRPQQNAGSNQQQPLRHVWPPHYKSKTNPRDVHLLIPTYWAKILSI